MLLVDRVAIVVEVVWRGLPAVLKTSEHDSGDITTLWSQSIILYRYVLLYIVDNAGRHDIDFGR